jgi:very-short-patch-repair endonuclease
MGAVLACGGDSVLSHMSAAALWGIRAMKREPTAERRRPEVIHVSVPRNARLRDGIKVHRATRLALADRASREGVPLTSPARTLIDLGNVLPRAQLEAAVNEADRLGLVDPESLRSGVGDHRGCRGVVTLRKVLDRRTFALTDSELERRFMPLIARAGLPAPMTQQHVNGFRVDFFWPELGLVVETDGLRYHRTASQQSRDHVRDQAHVASGLTVLRFSHAQVRFEAAKVVSTLRAVAHRCRTILVEFPGGEPG